MSSRRAVMPLSRGPRSAGGLKKNRDTWGLLKQNSILRSPGRGSEKDTRIIKLRLHQFVSGNFKGLVGHWAQDVLRHEPANRAMIRSRLGQLAQSRIFLMVI